MEKITQPIQQKTLIRKSIEDVYRTITTTQGWNAWFTTAMKLEMCEGGKINFCWKDWGAGRVNTEAEGKVLAFREPEFFKFEWNYSLDGGPTTVTLKLSETDEGTLLDVEDAGFPNTSQGWHYFNSCATGWGEALTLIKFYLEHGLSTKRT